MASADGALRALRALATLEMGQAVADVALAVRARRETRQDLEAAQGCCARVVAALDRPAGAPLPGPAHQAVLRGILRAEATRHARAVGRLEEAVRAEEAQRQALAAARHRDRTFERAQAQAQARRRAERERADLHEADELWLRRLPRRTR